MVSNTAISALPERGKVTAAVRWPGPRGPLVRRTERAALLWGPGAVLAEGTVDHGTDGGAGAPRGHPDTLWLVDE